MKLFINTTDSTLITNLSGEGSSLTARKTGHKETLDDEYNGAPSVLNIKLMFDLLCRNWPFSHNLV